MRRDPGPVFEALADRTRRDILRTVADTGPVTATSIAADLPISRQAVSKHLHVLGGAGLVSARRSGRETRWQLRPQPLSGVADWVAETASSWDRRLRRLAAASSKEE